MDDNLESPPWVPCLDKEFMAMSELVLNRIIPKILGLNPTPDPDTPDFVTFDGKQVPVSTLAAWLGLQDYDPALEENSQHIMLCIRYLFKEHPQVINNNFRAFVSGCPLDMRGFNPPLTPRRTSPPQRVPYVPGHPGPPGPPPQEVNSVNMFQWWTEVLRWLQKLLDMISRCVSKKYQDLNVMNSGPQVWEVGHYTAVNFRRELTLVRSLSLQDKCVDQYFSGPEFLADIGDVPTLEDIERFIEFKEYHEREMAKHYCHLFYLCTLIEESLIPMVQEKLAGLKKGKMIMIKPPEKHVNPVDIPEFETEDEGEDDGAIQGDLESLDAASTMFEPEMEDESMDDVTVEGEVVESHNAENKLYIKVFAVGGGASKAVNQMVRPGATEFWAVDVDSRVIDLPQILSSRKLMIGTLRIEKPIVVEGKADEAKKEVIEVYGKARQDPGMGLRAANECSAVIEDALKCANVVVITATLGGGTGMGASPFIARMAKSMGMLTVGVVTTPFDLEGKRDIDGSLENMRRNVHMLVTVENEKLLDRLGSFSFGDADKVLEQCISAVCDGVMSNKAVCALLRNVGSTYLGVGVATGSSRSHDAVLQAISSAHLDTKIGSANAIMLSISGGSDLTPSEVDSAVATVRTLANGSAELMLSTVTDPLLIGQVRIVIILIVAGSTDDGINDMDGGDQVKGNRS